MMDETALKNYLPAPPAQALATQMLDLLAHVGRLVTANFGRKVCNGGYLDTFMRWDLIDVTGKEVEAMRLCAAQSPEASCWTCLEGQQYMIYSEVRRVSRRQYVV
ncbi:MAG: hypothetical protein DMG05_11700 [Acidobacteria bacterium]|nr:MAG: hypothetical protein DMG05_11700 [Acidobacteriota bacterium]